MRSRKDETKGRKKKDTESGDEVEIQEPRPTKKQSSSPTTRHRARDRRGRRAEQFEIE